jgi:hypothetical protein
MNYNEIAKQSVSKGDFSKKLGFSYHNGRIAAIINGIIKDNSIDISHFKKNGGGWNKKYPFIERICPVCEKKFMTQIGCKKEKKTCGYSCANKYFLGRTRVLKSYTSICFKYHKKECVICGEKNVVGVHHFDENHDNDFPENLIPLCPTHHQYWHSRYKNLIFQKIVDYREKFLRFPSL